MSLFSMLACLLTSSRHFFCLMTDTEKIRSEESCPRIYMRKKQQVTAIDDEDNNRSDVCVRKGTEKRNHSDARVLREKKERRKE